MNTKCCNHNKNIFYFTLFIIIMFLLIICLISNFTQKNLDSLTLLNSGVQIGEAGETTLIFNTKRAKKTSNIIHTDSSKEIILNKPGIYSISYNVTGSLDFGGDDTSFSVGIYLNNILVQNSLLQSLTIPSGQSTTLSNTTLVEITSIPTNLTLSTNANSRIAYQDVSISIVKISN